MTRTPAFGLTLATVAVLILTPDTLLMRLSGLDGPQMVAWRGLVMGTILVTAGLLLRRAAPASGLWSAAGIGLVLAHAVNAASFGIGIAIAPVSVVLIGVATVPVFAAILSGLFLGERTRPATWITMAVVMAGIALAVSGDGGGVGNPLLGGLCGLITAAALAATFVILRGAPHVPIALAVGCGALLSGMFGLSQGGLTAMTDGVLWPILITGAVILPVSFFALSLASRYTLAANVSLILLLETVLAPVWVWLGIGEAPTLRMIAGGTIVLGALAVFLVQERRMARRAIEI